MHYRLVVVAGGGVLLGLLALVAWHLTTAAPIFSKDDPRLQGGGDVRRGEMVFTAGECASCHASPGQPDSLHLGGGLALASPFGTFRPPNISPDPTDGIGNWEVSDLANALIAGVSPEKTHYYPAFPYTSYTGMSLSDVKDLYAYLKTLPAVKGRPPGHTPTILFAIRRPVGFWKLLFFRPGGNTKAGDQQDDRGRYLVEALSHCAECHSSRNAFGAIRQETRFAGAVDPSGVGYVPNITPSGIGNWTEDQIVKMLTDGSTPDHGRVGSSMSDVVTNTAKLPESDRRAIAAYIKSLPARATPQP
jgi:mono/diheme cytochrome c family protein